MMMKTMDRVAKVGPMEPLVASVITMEAELTKPSLPACGTEPEMITLIMDQVNSNVIMIGITQDLRGPGMIAATTPWAEEAAQVAMAA